MFLMSSRDYAKIHPAIQMFQADAQLGTRVEGWLRSKVGDQSQIIWKEYV
jgi:hypothetical protein